MYDVVFTCLKLTSVLLITFSAAGCCSGIEEIIRVFWVTEYCL
jgi:hypothetical protein